NVIEKAAIFHYRFVAIHPFDDGNGRLARILMNLILMKEGLLPCIIRKESRIEYLRVLERSDQEGDYEPFILFINSELLDTYGTFMRIIQGEDIPRGQLSTKTASDERQDIILDTLRDNAELLSIGHIHRKLPTLKRPTLKADLQAMLKKGVIVSTGQ